MSTLPPFNAGPPDKPYNDHHAATAVDVYYHGRIRHLIEGRDNNTGDMKKNFEFALFTLQTAWRAEKTDPTPWFDHFTPMERYGLWGYEEPEMD